MIFWCWLSLIFSDHSDLWVAVKLFEMSGLLLGRKVNVYATNSSSNILMYCFQYLLFLLARFLLPREDFVGDKSKGCELPGSDGQVGLLIFIGHFLRISQFPLLCVISGYSWKIMKYFHFDFQAPGPSPRLTPASLDWCLCQYPGQEEYDRN